LDQDKLPEILKNNTTMAYIMKKIYFLVMKITDMKEKVEIEEVLNLNNHK